jgi:hypothetical protein
MTTIATTTTADGNKRARDVFYGNRNEGAISVRCATEVSMNAIEALDMRSEVEMAAGEVLKRQRRICSLEPSPAAAAAAAAAGMKMHVFSAAGNSAKVGSVVLVPKALGLYAAAGVKHAFTTSALGMDDNFDKLAPVEGGVDFSSTENFAFGLCKAYFEVLQVQALMNFDNFKAYLAYNADKPWLSDEEKAEAAAIVDDLNYKGHDDFVKRLMLDSVRKTIEQCLALQKKAAEKNEEGDVLMHSLIPGMQRAYEVMKRRVILVDIWDISVDYFDFKRAFLLDNITKLQPETAKMAIGRCVIYSAIAQAWEGEDGLATWAVYFTRMHFLCHHPDVAYTFFMVNFPHGGKEYSKFDDVWAQKYAKPLGKGALCDVVSPSAEAAAKCAAFVLSTVDDTSKLLGIANARVVEALYASASSTAPTFAATQGYIKAKRFLAFCGWRDAVNAATCGDVFNPPKLPAAHAECIRTATVDDSCRFVARLDAYLRP